ncbi:unnamed protein product [Wuchereria bancrofti]|nr:unnamed protein product [Wuchereria bancrofti]
MFVSHKHLRECILMHIFISWISMRMCIEAQKATEYRIHLARGNKTESMKSKTGSDCFLVVAIHPKVVAKQSMSYAIHHFENKKCINHKIMSRLYLMICCLFESIIMNGFDSPASLTFRSIYYLSRADYPPLNVNVLNFVNDV